MPDVPKPITRKPPRMPDLRPSAHARGYDGTWERLRLAVLADEPTCRHCRADGLIAEATMVDHVVPINDGGARLDRSNLQPLCDPCHAAKTAEDVARRRSRL